MTKYIDFDILYKNGVYCFSDIDRFLDSLFSFVNENSTFTYIMPFTDYTRLVEKLTDMKSRYRSSGQANGRPYISVAGIKFIAITKEEAMKYQMLK